MANQSLHSRAAADGDLASSRGWHKLKKKGHAPIRRKKIRSETLRPKSFGLLRGKAFLPRQVKSRNVRYLSLSIDFVSFYANTFNIGGMK
jgi:hypothetical protein